MAKLAIVAAIMIGGCLGPAVSHADICHSPESPATLPEPATASDADILAAQQEVKKYLADMESSLKCLTATHNDIGYNHAVENMQRTATAFNGVLRAYRARQQKT